MKDCKISVIVPVYKVEKYLKRCVDSIINQTYQNLEVILVDDGSPDGCGAICDEYAARDSRVIVIHQENGGQSKARNEAMKIATGEYYCFVDSDDYMSEDLINVLYQMIIDYDAQVSMSGFCNFKNDYVTDQDIVNSQSEIFELTGYECIQNMHMVHDELYVVMWGKLFHRSLFENVPFPEGRICEDLAVLFKIFDKCKKVVYTKETLYYYFRGNESSSTFSIKDKFYQDVFLALEEEIQYLHIHHNELVDYPTKTYMYWTFDYYYKLKKKKCEDKEKLRGLHKLFQKLYRECKGLPKEKFYVFFYYMPDLYCLIK